MKIAILTSGILPIPAVQGGAVENLIDLYLDYNRLHRLHNIVVYSIWHSNAMERAAVMSGANKYIFIKCNSVSAKFWRFANRLKHRKGYYHDSIEYYLHKTLRQIKKGHYDLIVVENRPGYALTLRNLCNVPCVLHLHNDFVYSEVENVIDICNVFHRIICVSDYITNRVKSICADNAKCLTVHNAIDVKRFQNATPISRQSLGLSDDDFVLVFSGRLIAEKGILQLIRAMVKLQCIPQLKLLIIGANSYGTGQRPTLFIQQLEKESSVLHNSIIYTGFIDYASIPSYLKIADMAVLPSMWEEPFGLTVVEAMAAGLPLITTRSGGIPEICEGIAVVITHDNIVEQLSTAIFDLYKHPEKRKEMAQASLERSKLFDKDTYAKNFFDALQGLA